MSCNSPFLGPITNLVLNAKEMSRFLTCGAKLAHNQTMSRLELTYQPLYAIMTELQVIRHHHPQ